MKPARILSLVIVCLLLTACGGSPAGGAKIQPLPENVRAACPHPSEFLSVRDWEIMAGRLGDELIACDLKRGAAVTYVDTLAEVVPDYWKDNW